MKKTGFFLAAAAVMLLVSANLQAGPRRFGTPQEYAYGSSIDMQAGLVGMPFNYIGEVRTANGMSGGGEFQLRYTYFPGRHWGAFASWSYDGGLSDPRPFFSVVNRADGDMYKYSQDRSNWMDEAMGYRVNTLIAGVCYRYDTGQWSIRPRLGIGAAYSELSSTPFVRMDRETDQPLKQYCFSEVAPKEDFYADGDYSTHWGFAAYAGLQATYTFRHHFYLSLECGFKAFTSAMKYSRMEYDFVPAYHPDNWPEAVAQDQLRNSWEVDMDSCVTSRANRPWALLNINFGIGWNIGWNRNASR